MLTDEVIKVFYEAVLGKKTIGQVLNTVRYFLSNKELVLKHDPVYLTMHLTHACNLHCDMCLTHSTKHENIYG